jgi:hypothetical protein
VYSGYRYYAPTCAKWLNRDPIQERGGWNLYAYAHNNCPNSFDALGLCPGPLALKIKQLKRELALEEYEQAATTARKLYVNLAAYSADIYPLASSMMSRWLLMPGSSGAGRLWNFTPDETLAILKDKFVRHNIGVRLREQGLKGAGSLEAYPIKMVTAASPADYFYALGWFEVRFTGSYEVVQNTATLCGTFRVIDRYDWQDPGDKSAPILGCTIYDKWATLVEDHQLATPFAIHGSTATTTLTFDLRNKAIIIEEPKR